MKWTCHFKSGGWPVASPVIAGDGTIYQTLVYDSNLYAVDPNNGSIIWTTDLSVNCEFVDLYIALNGSLPPVEQIRENCRYWIQLPTELDTYYAYLQYRDASGWSEPVLGPDGTIYVSFDDPYLRAVDSAGVIKWIADLGTIGGFTLTVGNNGNIYAASDDGYLYVLNPDGEEIARFQSDSWLNFPVIADNLLIVADSRDNSLLITYENNKVYALTPECPEDREPDLHWPADLNSDGVINVTDMTLLATYWLK
jgi:outer membrane protein assembly factor BamB